MPCQEVAKMTDQQVVKDIVLLNNTHFLNQINFVGLFNSAILFRFETGWIHLTLSWLIVMEFSGLGLIPYQANIKALQFGC